MKKEPFLVKYNRSFNKKLAIIVSIFIVIVTAFLIIRKPNTFKNIQEKLISTNYDGFLLSNSNIIMNDSFSIVVPSVFIDKSLAFNYEYYYDNQEKEVLNRCHFSLISPYGYADSYELIKEMHKYYRYNEPTNIEKRNINDLTWSWFKIKDIVGIKYFYGININDKAYLLEYNIEENSEENCEKYLEEILNSLKNK